MAVDLSEELLESARERGLENVTFLAKNFEDCEVDGPFDAVIGSSILHHLDEPSLERLFALAAERSHTLAACEPRRSAFALAASRLLWFIGCNDVTRHDAVVSVRAGFRGDELSRLWPRSAGWQLTERTALPFSHLFVARRNAS